MGCAVEVAQGEGVGRWPLEKSACIRVYEVEVVKHVWNEWRVGAAQHMWREGTASRPPDTPAADNRGSCVVRPRAPPTKIDCRDHRGFACRRVMHPEKGRPGEAGGEKGLYGETLTNGLYCCRGETHRVCRVCPVFAQIRLFGKESPVT